MSRTRFYEKKSSNCAHKLFLVRAGNQQILDKLTECQKARGRPRGRNDAPAVVTVDDPRSMRGFSLLEVLVAMMLWAMVVGMMFATYAVLLRSMLLSTRTVQAQGVAERAILSAQAQPCEWVDLEPTPRVIVDEGIPFEQRVVVEALPGAELWRFHATVSWRQLGRRYQVELMTHRSLYGLICPHWLAPYERP